MIRDQHLGSRRYAQRDYRLEIPALRLVNDVVVVIRHDRIDPPVHEHVGSGDVVANVHHRNHDPIAFEIAQALGDHDRKVADGLDLVDQQYDPARCCRGVRQRGLGMQIAAAKQEKQSCKQAQISHAIGSTRAKWKEGEYRGKPNTRRRA